MRQCRRCHTYKDDSDFKPKGHLCKSCRQATNKRGSEPGRLAKVAQGRELVNRLKAGGCVVCGEKESIALDLHHTDPSQKDRDFAALVGRGLLNQLEVELAKGYIVLCCNCHRKLHAGVINMDRYLMPGSRVRITIGLLSVTGTVINAAAKNWGTEEQPNWYAEIRDDAGEYRYYKQEYDHGTLTVLEKVS